MTDASIVIGIKGDLSQAPTIKRNLDEIAEKGDKATASTKKLETAYEKLQNRANNATRRLKELALSGDTSSTRFLRLAEQTKKYNEELLKADSAVKKLTESQNKTTASMDKLETALKAVFTAEIVRRVITIADEYTNLEARIRNATNSVKESQEAWRGLRDVSNQTGSSLSSAVDVFQRLSFVRNEINATIDDMVKFTGTVQKLGVISGSSTQATQAGLLQLGQAMSAGVVRAEEFNSVLENMPSVAKAIADQFGVTTGELRRLVLAGSVDSVDAFNAILAASQDVEAQYAQMPMTVGRAFAQLQNEFQNFVGETNKVSGASKTIIAVIDLMKLSVFGLGQAFEGLTNIIAAAFVGILKTIETQVNQILNMVNFVIEKSNSIGGFSISKIDNLNFAGGGYKDIYSGTGDLFSTYNTTKTPTTTFDTLFGGSDGTPAKTNISETGTELEELRKKYQRLLSLLKSGNTSSGSASSKTAITKIKDDVSEADKAMDSFVTRIEDDLSGAFKSAFTESDGGFKKMISGWKASFKDMLAELAYQAFARPIVMSVVGVAGGSGAANASSIFGGSAGSGGGGGSILGSLGNIGTSLLNGGLYSQTLGNVGAKIGANLFAGGDLLSGAAFTGAQAFGNLGYGALGSLGAQLFGLGGGVGGTVGGGIGSLVGGAFGPIGAVAGGFLGSAVGGLFGGGKPKRNTLGGLVNVNQQGLLSYSTNGREGSEQFIQSVVNPLNAIASALDTTFRQGLGSVETNTNRDIKTAIFHNQVLSGNVGDASAIIKYVLGNGSFLAKDTDQQLLGIARKSFGLNRGDVTKTLEDIDLAKFALGLNETADSLSPLQTALNELSDSFETMKSRAEALGLPIDKLTTSYDAQKKALITSALSPLQEFLDSQALGSASSLNPAQRLSLARSQFDTNLAAIQGGDLSNLGGITSQASNLLGIGRDVFASGTGFAALESYVRQSIAGIATTLGAPEGSLNDSIVSTISLTSAQQISIQEQMLVELQAVREENTKLRKSLERLSNQMVVTA
jgi:tape measure domain-containing protein